MQFLHRLLFMGGRGVSIAQRRRQALVAHPVRHCPRVDAIHQCMGAEGMTQLVQPNLAALDAGGPSATVVVGRRDIMLLPLALIHFGRVVNRTSSAVACS